MRACVQRAMAYTHQYSLAHMYMNMILLSYFTFYTPFFLGHPSRTLVSRPTRIHISSQF